MARGGGHGMTLKSTEGEFVVRTLNNKGCALREYVMDLVHSEITEQVIGAAFEVFRELGYGFLEKVYQQAMKIELESRGLLADIESDIQVRYKGQVVGAYRADILVNRSVVVELKVAPSIDSRDETQLLNELKATGIKVGLLINFGKQKAEFKRLVH
jgi:GxxExxY protein